MYIIIVLLFLLFILWKLKINSIQESFFPAWNDFKIYNQLSTRIKFGISVQWMNINGLAFGEQLFTYANVQIILFRSNNLLLDALIDKKSIDIAFVTEADYAMYICSKMKESMYDKEYIKNNKKNIKKTFSTRRLYTLNTIYRMFLADNFKIDKPSDLVNKTIQITNITNKLNIVDLDLLKNMKYNK